MGSDRTYTELVEKWRDAAHEHRRNAAATRSSSVRQAHCGLGVSLEECADQLEAVLRDHAAQPAPSPVEEAHVFDELIAFVESHRDGSPNYFYAGIDRIVREAKGRIEAEKDLTPATTPGTDWQPIDTCPQDGLFLVHQDGAIRCMYRSRGEWQATAVALDQWGCSTETVKVRDTGVYEPTHWMSVPDGPKPSPDHPVEEPKL